MPTQAEKERREEMRQLRAMIMQATDDELLRMDPLPHNLPGLPLRRAVLLNVRLDNRTGCWEWCKSRSTSRSNGTGYGTIVFGGKTLRAHRASYEAFKGPIPEGLVLGHRCNNEGCANPEHVRPITQQANVAESEGVAALYVGRTRCARGHELSGANLGRAVGGYRRCKACQKLTKEQRAAHPIAYSDLRRAAGFRCDPY